MFDTLIISTQANSMPNAVVLSDTLLKDLELAENTQMTITKHEDGRIELRPVVTYPKGDIRRVKGLVKTPIQASIGEMNEAIAQGAVYGE